MTPYVGKVLTHHIVNSQSLKILFEAPMYKPSHSGVSVTNKTPKVATSNAKVENQTTLIFLLHLQVQPVLWLYEHIAHTVCRDVQHTVTAKVLKVI